MSWELLVGGFGVLSAAFLAVVMWRNRESKVRERVAAAAAAEGLSPAPVPADAELEEPQAWAGQSRGTAVTILVGLRDNYRNVKLLHVVVEAKPPREPAFAFVLAPGGFLLPNGESGHEDIDAAFMTVTDDSRRLATFLDPQPLRDHLLRAAASAGRWEGSFAVSNVSVEWTASSPVQITEELVGRMVAETRDLALALSARAAVSPKE